MRQPSLQMRLFLVVITLTTCSSVAILDAGQTFFVASDGNDANPGSRAAPFASLLRARDAVRTWRQSNTGDVVVEVAGGVYRLRETLQFDLRDSCPEATSTTFRAAADQRPVLSAAWPITGWTKMTDRLEGCKEEVWVAELPRGIDWIATLYDREGLLHRAQEPGFFPEGGQGKLNSTTYVAGAVSADLDVDNAELNIVPDKPWSQNILTIAGHEAQRRILRTAVPATYAMNPPSFGKFPRGSAFIENTTAGLRQPGNWCVDRRSRKVYLIPRHGTPGDNIVAPALTELVSIEGKIDYDSSSDEPVRGIVFEGFTFMHGDRWAWQKTKQGWGLQHDWEMFDRPTAMVRLRGAEDCRFDGCRFAHSGATGIRFDLHCQRNSIQNSLIEHVGGVGVLFAGYGPGTKDVNRDNELRNCHIHHTGCLILATPAVFVWQSGHNRLVNNLIHDTPYCAVVISGRISYNRLGKGECARTVRWTEIDAVRGGQKPLGDWYDREPFMHARHNLLAFNEMHSVMQVLGDGNFVYVSGCGKGNVIRNNFMHDSRSYNINGNIRCDNDQHETVWENNVILRSTGEGFINKGKNTFRNNVFAAIRSKTDTGIENAHGRGYIVMPSEIPQNAIYERNIYLADEKGRAIVFHGKRRARNSAEMWGGWLWECQSDRNVYWNTEDPDWAEEFFAEVRPKGSDRNSISADPGFVDWRNGDFRLKPKAAAHRIGFEEVDVSACGLADDFPVWLRSAGTK